MAVKDIFYYLLYIAVILILTLLSYTLFLKKKSQIHYVFLGMISMMAIWATGNLLTAFELRQGNPFPMHWMKLWFIGNCYMPVFLYINSRIFRYGKIKNIKKVMINFIPPTISYLVLLTNDINGHLFFKRFDGILAQNVEYGPFFIIHTIISYVYLAVAIYLLISYAVNNSGLFSSQSFLMLLAAIIPISVNVLLTLRIRDIPLPVYSTTIAFTVTVTILGFSMFRYQFLQLTPNAMRTVLDQMEDGFTVIDRTLNITYCNASFMRIFHQYKPAISVPLTEVFRPDILPDFWAQLRYYIQTVETALKTLTFEYTFTLNNDQRIFVIDVTPITAKGMRLPWGILLFFKDTTEMKRSVETIKRNQAMLMEQEHLASLGQLIGGIAHNLKTPIMSLAGGLEALQDLSKEYMESIGDKSVTNDDHREIAREMLDRIEKCKPYCSYMSDIISAVRGQAVQLSDSTVSKFTVSELIKRVDILMLHELKKHHCILKIENHVPPEAEVPGALNNLIQIVDNIIVNAIQAYDGSQGAIEMKLIPCHRYRGNIQIIISDKAGGISQDVQKKLFKEMYTTKGAKGSGIGLYLSYLTIKGKFGGDMWFESEIGSGTTFYISVPAINIGHYTLAK